MEWYLVAAGAGMGVIGGSEIAMMTVAASTEYKWKKAWLVTFAGLATLIPLGALLYFFFVTLPEGLMELAAGGVIFALGAYFFYKGIKKRGSPEEEHEHEEKIGAGLFGIYTGIVLEGAEITTVIIALGAAAGAFAPAVLGLIIGVAIPLAAIRALKPLIEKVPEWALQTAVGAIMMLVAAMIML